ncbi:hypothetical protein OICFNHDK_2601 [Methylobacterium bullatum]|uniref:Uncharacterized protein n=1 Tax=Methylobacterium bullatum TaxID=570505 RepID=A0A679JZU4_9HYPH|nr:hypothetical protein OICFNHDK_2601 [Methylobacterium bullatum]CAA2137379.1 hypothetical protein MBLL_00627 [Methylobacterium bullatum]
MAAPKRSTDRTVALEGEGTHRLRQMGEQRRRTERGHLISGDRRSA